MSRFDYVKYDDQSNSVQAEAKSAVQSVENVIEAGVRNPRAKEYALKALEECYMWIGKAVRDDQLVRNGGFELQEGRVNS